MKATVGTTVVAEAPTDELVSIEGNWYFPPASVTAGLLRESPTPYHCPWKGDCQYFHIDTADETLEDGAWSYPKPIPASFERVGRDYSGYVAFDPRVTVGE